MQVSDVLASDRKYRAVQPHQRFIVNASRRLEWRLEWRLGLAPPGDAQLETTARYTGQPHHTPSGGACSVLATVDAGLCLSASSNEHNSADDPHRPRLP
jgi:hypothetical protein